MSAAVPAEFEAFAALRRPGESLQRYNTLRQAIFADLAPQSAIEWLLAIDVAEISSGAFHIWASIASQLIWRFHVCVAIRSDAIVTFRQAEVMIRNTACMLAAIYCVSSRPAYSDFQTREVLPPLSFTLFCAQYPEDCRQQQDRRITDFRSRGQRWRDLSQINSMVNFGIVPKKLSTGRNDYGWEIFPQEGNCGDYAVTKRHLLLQAGWPSSSLLLAEVIIRRTGEHHLVLLVREGRAVLVLDNLSRAVTNLNDALDQYFLVRAESDQDPQLWTRDVGAS